MRMQMCLRQLAVLLNRQYCFDCFIWLLLQERLLPVNQLLFYFSSIGQSKRVKIFKLQDPERGQTTLNFQAPDPQICVRLTRSISLPNPLTTQFFFQVVVQKIYWEINWPIGGSLKFLIINALCKLRSRFLQKSLQ